VAILITGGTGFLGSHLTRHLVAECGQSDLVLFDRFPSRERLGDLWDQVTVVEGDVLEPQEVLSTIVRHGIDRIAHLAFLPGAVQPEKIPGYVRMQVLGTLNVFEAARLAGLRRVIAASSVAVYGRGRAGTVSEDEPLTPRDWYGVCKQMAEQMARLYNEEHGMEIVSLRVCATLGYGRLRRDSLSTGLTRERVNFLAYPELALQGQPVTMPPDEQLMDVLAPADAAHAWWLALNADRLEQFVFNLRGERRPVGALTAHLRALLPDATIEVAPEPVPFTQLVDNARIVSELGFRPRYTLEQALEAYLNQARQASQGGLVVTR
jgi:UDP-glucose 4-epimerase